MDKDEDLESTINIWRPTDKIPPYQILASIAHTRLEWTCKINISSRAFKFIKTGLMCTIGPSSWEEKTIQKMIQEGMNIARLNFGISTHEAHLVTIKKIRNAVDNYSREMGLAVPLAVAIDTKGPGIRTGWTEGSNDLPLTPGQTLKLTTDKAFSDHCTNAQIYVDYDNIQKVVKAGNRIFIDNGLISLLVNSIQGNVLTTTVEYGNRLGSLRAVNLPGVKVDLPDITERDKLDFQFAVENDIDIILISFVRSATAITRVRELLGPGGKDISIFAKIQNQQGLDNIDEIIMASDGIVIVRGVLSIEIPHEKMLQTQKYLVARCNLLGKPCIVSSQFLGTMAKQIRPTSAEANDLANTVNEGADCVMLSSITANGMYPVESVTLAANICKEAETAIWQHTFFEDLVLMIDNPNYIQIMALAASRLAMQTCAAVIIVATKSGTSAFALSQFRPRCAIIAVTRSPRIARKCSVHRGVLPLIYNKPKKLTWRKDIEARINFAIRYCQVRKFVKTGDPMIIIAPTKPGYANSVRVVYSTNIPINLYV